MTHTPQIDPSTLPADRRSDRPCACLASDFETHLIEEIPHLRNYARSLAREPSEASDLVQDSVLRALEKRNQFSRGTHMRRWLFTILRNRHLDRRRQRGRRGPHIPIEDCGSAAGLAQAASQEDWLTVRETEWKLRRLRPVDRITLLLCVFTSLSHKDIADRAGIAEGTVRSRLSRGRAELRAT